MEDFCISSDRRRANTYARSISGLKRTLDMQKVILNFFRIHFTIKQVPAAVRLWILKQGLSWETVFRIRLLAV
jgi:hypothetical protein